MGLARWVAAVAALGGAAALRLREVAGVHHHHHHHGHRHMTLNLKHHKHHNAHGVRLHSQHVEKHRAGHKAAGWSVNPAEWENSMTLTIKVEINGAPAPSGTLAAFSGSECRGVQAAPMSPPFGPYAGKPMYSIMVYADGGFGEDVTFKFSDGSKVVDLDQMVEFQTNANHGSFVAPFLLSAVTHDAPLAAAGPPYWTIPGNFNYALFANSMTMTVVVDLVGGPAVKAGTLAAFDAGENLRGVQATPNFLPFGPMWGKAVYMMTIYGDAAGDFITFKFYDGAVHELNDGVQFVVNANLGNAIAPRVLQGKWDGGPVHGPTTPAWGMPYNQPDPYGAPPAYYN